MVHSLDVGVNDRHADVSSSLRISEAGSQDIAAVMSLDVKFLMQAFLQARELLQITVTVSAQRGESTKHHVARFLPNRKPLPN